MSIATPGDPRPHLGPDDLQRLIDLAVAAGCKKLQNRRLREEFRACMPGHIVDKQEAIAGVQEACRASYVRTIGVNKATDILRQEDRQRRWLDPDGSGVSQLIESMKASAVRSPEDEVMAREALTSIWRAHAYLYMVVPRHSAPRDEWVRHMRRRLPGAHLDAWLLRADAWWRVVVDDVAPAQAARELMPSTWSDAKRDRKLAVWTADVERWVDDEWTRIKKGVMFHRWVQTLQTMREVAEFFEVPPYEVSRAIAEVTDRIRAELETGLR